MAMTIRVELFVKDVAKSVQFYRDILGFEALPSHGNYHPVQNGHVILGIAAASELPQQHYFQPEIATHARKGVGIELVLAVDDVEKTYTKVKEAGYPIAEALAKRPWGLTDFRLVDPDGYYLRITST